MIKLTNKDVKWLLATLFLLIVSIYIVAVDKELASTLNLTIGLFSSLLLLLTIFGLYKRRIR